MSHNVAKRDHEFEGCFLVNQKTTESNFVLYTENILTASFFLKLQVETPGFLFALQQRMFNSIIEFSSVVNTVLLFPKRETVQV